MRRDKPMRRRAPIELTKAARAIFLRVLGWCTHTADETNKWRAAFDSPELRSKVYSRNFLTQVTPEDLEGARISAWRILGEAGLGKDLLEDPEGCGVYAFLTLPKGDASVRETSMLWRRTHPVAFELVFSLRRQKLGSEQRERFRARAAAEQNRQIRILADIADSLPGCTGLPTLATGLPTLATGKAILDTGKAILDTGKTILDMGECLFDDTLLAGVPPPPGPGLEEWAVWSN